MITRFGDYAQSTQLARILMSAQNRARDLQTQLGSQKLADRFRDLGAASKHLLDAKTSLQRTRQFQSDNRLVQGRLQIMEGGVSSLVDHGNRLRVLLMQRLSDGATTPGLTGSEARLMLEQVVNALNVAHEGRHLFGGARTDTPPVRLDPTFAAFGSPDDTYYQGDQVELAVMADQGLSLAYGMTADRQGFRDLIGALRATVEGDAANDRALLEGALDLVNQALPKLSDYRSELGARHRQIEQINELHSGTDVYLQGRISDIEDVDLAELLTRFTQDQVAIQASLATIARLSRMTLADYLR